MKDTFKSQCEALIKAAIAEDCPNGDVTVSTFFNSSKYVHASLIAKESGVFFGKEIIEYFFKLYDSDSKVLFLVNDGNDVKIKHFYVQFLLTSPRCFF